MTLSGWARVNKFKPGMVRQVINKGYYSPKIVQAISEQGLYKKLAPEIRMKLEQSEDKKIEQLQSIIKRRELYADEPENL